MQETHRCAARRWRAWSARPGGRGPRRPPTEFKTIFDGTSGDGWITNNGKKPLPKANVQADGLNPHGSGGYIVVHEKPHGDFVLDFDYKLTKGCNSGVFLRVGDLKDPVMTGLEIAIDDTTGTGLHDPGRSTTWSPPGSTPRSPPASGTT